MKTCSKCGVPKELTEFVKDSKAPDGLKRQCKVCKHAQWLVWADKNREALNKAARDKVAADRPAARARVRRSDLKHRLGTTPEEKDRMFAEQSGACAICGDVFPTTTAAHFDHIHGTQPVVIRGLLCSSCNYGLGCFKDSFSRLLKAASYLKKFL